MKDVAKLVSELLFCDQIYLVFCILSSISFFIKVSKDMNHTYVCQEHPPKMVKENAFINNFRPQPQPNKYLLNIKFACHSVPI